MEAEAQRILQHCSQETSMQEKEIGPVEKKKNHKDPAKFVSHTIRHFKLFHIH